MEEQLLGFDAREMWLDGAEQWDDRRRAVFLLRTDVEKPLSTDTLVWPSVFDLVELPRPAWIGANAGLWEDLSRMREHLDSHWPAPRPQHAIIAVSWFTMPESVPVGQFGPYPEPTVPAARDPAWTLVGLDVTDGSLLSGLMNCGYHAEEVGPLRSRWASSLNEHHLFSDLGAAFEFRQACDIRVPEHAPFQVYGIYLVGEPPGVGLPA